ncbi:uncharacterized protein LOC141643335 isoform X1 [Silene latifolia]|uniref:uncharacterized protein LOC141643335 isoform X1 n=1 Tax=Silene latifolia TaxID=37657 RepID=UPI003D77CC9A
MQCASSMALSSSYTSLLAFTPTAAHNHTTSVYQHHHNNTVKSFHGKHKINNNVLISQETPIIPKLITSTSNPFVKHCVKLRQSSSYRHSHGFVLLVGSTLIREIHEFHVLKQDHQTAIECLILLENAEVPEGIDEIQVDRVYVSSLVMKKLSGVQSTESIDAIALMRIPTSFLNLNDNQTKTDCARWFGSVSTHRILLLEGIQDPGNLGTLLRSALAFKWNGVFMLPGCCDPFNEKAIRASRGAPFQLPIVSGNWDHLEAFRNDVEAKVMAGHPNTSNEAKPVHLLSQGLADSLAEMPLCLVLGSEGSGLSEKARQFSELVSIPMASNFESLNVAVAGGIFMFVLQSKSPENALVDVR